MHTRLKDTLKKWFYRLLWLLFFGVICLINVERFKNNNYANYEKAIDYGRVREEKEEISPIIAAVFYQNDARQKSTISSYLNHWDTYRMEKVKMLIVPQKIDSESQNVITKLYERIQRHNQIKYIALVYDKSQDIQQHQQLLAQVFTQSAIDIIPLNEQQTDTEFDIQDYLNDVNTMVVFTADLSHGLTVKKRDFLLSEAIYFAQKNSFKIRVFDEVDTQLAKALEDDYAVWFEQTEDKTKERLEREKNNLKMYAERYKDDILQYFALNLNSANEEKPIWPEKDEQTFRLFDRGMVYVRFFGAGGKEIFARAKIGKNKGIIVAVVELAHKAAIKMTQPIEKARIYLLTELERIEKIANAPLVNYLETDDGIYVQYKSHRSLMAADERPTEEKALTEALYNRGKIPENTPDSEIEFYKFKTVEIDYEN